MAIYKNVAKGAVILNAMNTDNGTVIFEPELKNIWKLQIHFKIFGEYLWLFLCRISKNQYSNLENFN